MWKSTFFARFSLLDSRCMSDAITSTKLEQTGEIFWDNRCCLNACVSSFWARRMQVKWGVILFMCWLQNTDLIDFVWIQSHYIRLNGLVVNLFWNFLKHFLKGSTDYVIYRDYMVNRHFLFFSPLLLIYCTPVHRLDDMREVTRVT